MEAPLNPDAVRHLTPRLWPGVAAAAVLVLLKFVLAPLLPSGGAVGIIGGMIASLAILLWWLLFSRVPWVERAAAVLLLAAALLGLSAVVHPSIRNGMMGMMLPLFAIPLLCLALVGGAAAGRRLSSGRRLSAIACAALLASGVVALVRTAGVTGEGTSELRWRWTETPEQRLLAAARDEELPHTPAVSTDDAAHGPSGSGSARAEAAGAAPGGALDTASPAVPGTSASRPDAPAGETRAAGEGDSREHRDPAGIRVAWPGFRGPARDAVVRGLRIDTDWSANPPREIWRRAVGPGWSSFAVDGDFLYTQEQRGDDEVVSCYRLSTGAPVWMHKDPVRFWESNAGAGPRATPAVHDGRVYALGATGTLNALNARTGARIWSRNAAADAEKEIPEWGLASSPIVVDDLVIVAVAGRLAAYDTETGAPRWFGPEGGNGYSSPHLVTIDGVPQVLLLRGSRTTSVAPADGRVLWEHTGQPSVGILQPALVDGRDVLIAPADMMGGMGVRRISVSRGTGAWDVQDRWATRGLKPYFSDFVVHDGHAFGFDGSILSCIDLADGERRWKGGRYGHGQMVLLPDQDLLLVLSEHGELALVSATADQYREVARIPALEGKTWNHPVIAGDVLLVRNGEEMAAFRLPVAGR